VEKVKNMCVFYFQTPSTVEWISDENKLIEQEFLEKTTLIEKLIRNESIKEIVEFNNQGELQLYTLTYFQAEDDHSYLIILYNVTSFISLQESLLNSENKFESLIQTAVDGIVMINARGKIEMVNPAVSRLFGFTKEEMIGQNITVLMNANDHDKHDGYLKNYHDTGLKKVIGIGRDVIGRKKDGTEFPLTLSVSEFWLNGTRFYTGFLHDLSEQKRAQEQLKKYAIDLKRSNSELQEFAYVSSHDLQEPLRKIQAFGDLLKQKDGNALSEKGADYLDRMLNAASRMQKLIEELLEFSRVSTVKQPFQLVSLNQIIKDVLSDLEIHIQEKNAEIVIDKLSEVYADEIQMRQLFQNLITNALKFSKIDTQPKIKIYQEIKNFPENIPVENGQIVIAIKDNGIGFEQKYADKIFQVFQRLEGKKYEGSGIGLAICKKIARRHNGDIFVQSTLGEGTIFFVVLSVKPTIILDY
jgi:two-component system sensor kinase FixL